MQTLTDRTPSPNHGKLPRLGQINFANVLPVVLPLAKHKDEGAAEVIFATPSELNHQFSLGNLDAGSMSSFFFLKSGLLELFEGPSISSIGDVGSVLFFSKCPIEKLGGKKIVVPKASATSINLLRVLLMETSGVQVSLEASDRPDFSAEETAGVIVMGDHALKRDEEFSAMYERFDMGRWWFDFTGLPMVFGVWAARREWSKANPDAFAKLDQSLKSATAEGLGPLFPEVLAEAKRRLPQLSDERIIRYYKNELNFSWSEEHQSGLFRYRDLCRKHGLLPGV